MAVKTYTINGAGQRCSYEIPFDNTPDSKNGGISKPGGTLISISGTVRIGCDQTDASDYYQGATAIIGRFSFTTSADVVSKIELKKIEWTGRFGQVYAGGKNPISQPKCLITKNPSPANYLDIWAQGTSITISNNTNASAENVIVYSENFSTTGQLLEPNTTYYIFVFDTYNYPGGVGAKLFDTSEGSLVVTTEVETYTNIGKPSNIKATASYVKPGGSLTVTWTKAANGTNNPVKNYTLTWKVGSGDSKIISGITTASYDITMPNDETIRGLSISCSIQAIPTQSGYGSEAVTNNDIAKINRLPSAPTVTPSQTIVPSTGGSVKFALSGSDPDGQNISFMYKNALFANGSIIKITEKTTFKFWINDGLEDGPATEITIYKNTQPTFDVSVSGGVIAPSTKITSVTETLGISNVYTCYLVYGTTTKLIGTNNTGSFSIADIRSYGLSPDTGYSFTITRNDGIETYSKSRIGADQLVAPACPTYVCGNHSSDKYVSELEGYFDSDLLPTFSNVVSLDCVKITINNKEFIFDLHKGNPNYYFDLDDEALNTFVRGISTPMKIVFGKDALFFPAYSIEKNFTRVINGADALSNLVLNGFNLFAGTPMLTFRNMYSSDYQKYGFVNNPLSEGTTYTFQVSFNETVPLDVNFYPASIASNDQISYWLNGQEIYGNLVNNLEHEKQHTVSVTVSFVNDLGGIASKTISTVVDCGIDINLTGTPPGLSAQDKEISAWNYLLQGMSIKNSSFTYKAYSEDLHAQIYVSRDSGKTWIAYSQIDGEPTGTLSYLNPRTFKFNSTDLTTIGSTSLDYSPQFKIKLFTNKNVEVLEKEIELNKTITVKALIAPTINIVSGTYEKDSEGNGTITIKYQFDDNNDNTITRNSLVELYIGTEEGAKGSWKVDADQVITQDHTIDDKIESILVYLKGIVTASAATTTDTEPSYTISITTETPAYTIFNIQPTVSYRKNRLGINSSIDGTGNENYVIKIASSGSSSATQIALVSKKGAVRVIDIEEGTLANFNFIIDCGTWDT